MGALISGMTENSRKDVTKMAAQKQVHTVSTDKGWRNKAGNNRPISNHRTKKLAEKAGRKLAIERKALHIVHNTDGRVTRKVSYA